MKKILLLLVVLLLLTGCSIIPIGPKGSKGNSLISEEDFTTMIFIIDAENEEGQMECDFAFDDEFAYYYDGYGMMYAGTYSIKGNTVNINFDEFYEEYSEDCQDIDVDVVLKMKDEKTLVVAKTPKHFMLKTSEPTEDGWEYDGGEKEMWFDGIYEGATYIGYYEDDL
jgi:hypothetical protein